jgi:hypothetical protein
MKGPTLLWAGRRGSPGCSPSPGHPKHPFVVAAQVRAPPAPGEHHHLPRCPISITTAVLRVREMLVQLEGRATLERMKTSRPPPSTTSFPHHMPTFPPHHVRASDRHAAVSVDLCESTLRRENRRALHPPAHAVNRYAAWALSSIAHDFCSTSDLARSSREGVPSPPPPRAMFIAAPDFTV